MRDDGRTGMRRMWMQEAAGEGWAVRADHEGEGGEGHGEEEGDEGGAEEEALRGPEGEEAPGLLSPRRGEETEVLFCATRRVVTEGIVGGFKESQSYSRKAKGAPDAAAEPGLTRFETFPSSSLMTGRCSHRKARMAIEMYNM